MHACSKALLSVYHQVHDPNLIEPTEPPTNRGTLLNWVDEEMETLILGDQRLDNRAKVLLNRLAAQPSTSLPCACRGWAETLAAYRFFDNEKVTAEKILAPHISATLRRMENQPVVLCMQDTS